MTELFPVGNNTSSTFVAAASVDLDFISEFSQFILTTVESIRREST